MTQFPTHFPPISINTIMQTNKQQYSALIEVLKPHIDTFNPKQRDALVGLERSLNKGVFTETQQKRLMGLFTWLQQRMANTEPLNN